MIAPCPQTGSYLPSSIYAVTIEPVAKEYHIGNVTSTLGVSLFLLGFVLGPVLFGPASEVFGRRVPLFAGYFVFAVFQVPVAVAQNVETIMLGRFFGGFAASAPLAVVGGAMADIWGPIERAYAISVFAAAAFVSRHPQNSRHEPNMSLSESVSWFEADGC